MSILHRSELSATPGTILASEPFFPMILVCNGAHVKFYRLTILSSQDYADAELSYDEKTSPEYLFERGFIVQHYPTREVLGFRNTEDNTFHLLSAQPHYVAHCEYTQKPCGQSCAKGVCTIWDDIAAEANDPVLRRQRLDNHDCGDCHEITNVA